MVDFAGPTIATEAVRTVELDPLSSFLWGYSDYIIFGIGVFLIMYFGRRLVMDYINRRSGATDDGQTEDTT